MSIPERKYHSPGLHLTPNDKNPYLIATKYYTECFRNYFSVFNSKVDLVNELKREDINTVCMRELEDLRGAVANLSYKDVVSSQNIHLKHAFYEEILVKNRK